MSLSHEQIKNILEAALMAAGQPLSIDRLLSLFLDDQQPSRDQIRDALKSLADDCEKRGIELKEVNSGFRFQAKQDFAPWISRLWEEKPPRYSRALLETLSLIAYRQPITRGEIEDVRGVSVSTNIIKTLLERDWVKVVGHRDVPGKPAMYATTKQFLDYFNLKNLSELPTLAEIRDIDSINAELDLVEPGSEGRQQGGEEGSTEEEVAHEAAGENVNEDISLASDEGVMEEMTDPQMSDDAEIVSDMESMPPIDDGVELKAVSVADSA
jgi:segregation and condensation protein B